MTQLGVSLDHASAIRATAGFTKEVDTESPTLILNEDETNKSKIKLLFHDNFVLDR